LGDYDLRDDLKRLDVPTLMIHGRHDPIPLWTAEETADALGAELVIFDHSGHVPYVEEFERFRDTLDRFLPKSARAGRTPSTWCSVASPMSYSRS
jgi:proline iminopeptidase